ncbi:hypothetical protein CTAYLR_008964 [Chrysophaeum taylorii]|uniref:Ndc10 domain-containing protein n=1 Tax=Chrysophaeum taylorii TaxID=2483200 RepID=A0AAD7ULP6_9STRA|nr:hypothetical protein CTAYLR_008964 [Chrysophaeum taylorii]
MTPSETPGARRDERTSSGAAATATAERSAQVSRDLRASQLERRPANTSKSYGTSAGPGTRWIKQFREFVAAAPGSTLYGNRIDPDREAYDGGDDLVTPDKCLEFLRFTAGRAKLDSYGKPIDGDVVGISTLRQLLKALAPHPEAQHPLARSHYGVAIVLSNHAKDTARRKRQKYLCRHTRALLVGYNDEQHGMLCEYALFDGAPGPTERNKLFRGTRARFAHVVQHVLALRGDSLRKAQLADWLVFQTRSAEGPTLAGCSSFSTTTARRTSRDTPTCLHFSMALYLFTMWTVLGVRKPNYTPYAGVDEKDGQPIVVREWMDYFLVFDGKPAGRRGKSGPPDPKNPLSDKAMLDETKGMYARIAVPIEDPEHVVHLRRGEALRMAEAAGVGRDELRQAAHHRQADALSVSYCNDFPMRFIRHSAGFPIDGGCYYVARSLEPVPDRLRNMVFGSVVDPVRAMMRSDEATFDRNTRNHLDMLDHLAECLVQDAALMRKLGKMDDHPMWGFAPFNTKEFADYVERQDAAMKNMPIERLRMTAAAAQERGDTLTAAAINAIYASLCDTHHKVAAAAVPSTTTAVRLANTPARQLSEIHSRVCDAQSRPEATVVPAGRSTARSGHADPPATPPRRLATEDMADDELMFGMRPLVVADSSTWDEDPLPNSRREVAQEYFRGVDGGPPVKELERFYGPKKRSGMGKNGKHSWRSNGTRKDNRAFEKAFSKRAVIYEVLDARGEDAGVAFLDGLIKDQFPHSRKSEFPPRLAPEGALKAKAQLRQEPRPWQKGRDGGPSKKQRLVDGAATHDKSTNADNNDDDLPT